MTQEAPPPIKTLADIFAQVNCTAAQGVLILGRFTALAQDLDQPILDNLNAATTTLQQRDASGL